MSSGKRSKSASPDSPFPAVSTACVMDLRAWWVLQTPLRGFALPERPTAALVTQLKEKIESEKRTTFRAIEALMEESAKVMKQVWLLRRLRNSSRKKRKALAKSSSQKGLDSCLSLCCCRFFRCLGDLSNSKNSWLKSERLCTRQRSDSRRRSEQSTQRSSNLMNASKLTKNRSSFVGSTRT